LRPTSAASHIAFFGTQPALTQVPPRSPGSSSATRAPCSAARNAPASPPDPPPTTIRSKSPSIPPSCPTPRPRPVGTSAQAGVFREEPARGGLRGGLTACAGGPVRDTQEHVHVGYSGTSMCPSVPARAPHAGLAAPIPRGAPREGESASARPEPPGGRRCAWGVP